MCIHMIQVIHMENVVNYKPKEFAELLSVTVKTLQRCDRKKILGAKRSPTNRRYYTYDQYLEFKGLKQKVIRKTVIYTRVSTNNQKDDLVNQISCKIYGLRKYKKRIKEDSEVEKSIQDRNTLK